MAVTVQILNVNGEPAGNLDVSDAVLGQPDNPQVVRAVLDCYLANQRQGSANTRTRGEVRGGGAKPWRQKGTGRARAGTNRSPLWVGGSRIFGPKPRDFGYRVNRKVRRRALLSVLSAIQRDERLFILDAMELPAQKTREVVALRDRLNIAPAQKALIVTEAVNETVCLAARNLASSARYPTLVVPVNNINIFNLLHCDYLILTTGALKALEETYQ